MSEDGTAFLEKLFAAHAAFVRGDVAPMMEVWSHQDDVTLMGGFGAFQRGWKAVGPRLQWASSQFRDGVHEDNVLSVFFHDGFGCLVSTERVQACVAGAAERTQMTLRVTQVFRLESSEWRVVHRHADMLGPGVPARK